MDILDINLDIDYNLYYVIFLATDDADINGWTYFDFYDFRHGADEGHVHPCL